MTSHADITSQLTSRWPENRIAPSLGRIRALCDLLGDPQSSFKVIHVAGTNGKGSTSVVIESLLRADGLRVGRYSSPHLERVNERICIDGEPISDERFDEIWSQIAPYVAMVDDQQIDGVSMTFFEVVTAMAFAAFADAPVDVAVIEVGLGGSWDATNVVDADVAVITPIDLDHTHILGRTVLEIAAEKAGIIKAGARAVLAGQQPEVARLLLERCLEVGAEPIAEGVDFGVLERTPAVGGQVVRIDTEEGPIGDLHLPLLGAHFARNAGLGVAAAEALVGGIDPAVLQEGFDLVEVPGRMEVVRRSPTVVLDAAHNPHGALATAEAIAESFAFTPLVGVFAAMGDKDVESMLRIWEESMNQIVCTQVSTTARGLPASGLGELAVGIFGEDRVRVVERMDDAIETAVGLADAEGAAAPGVLVTGSVIAVGEARSLLVKAAPSAPRLEPMLEIGADDFGGTGDFGGNGDFGGWGRDD